MINGENTVDGGPRPNGPKAPAARPLPVLVLADVSGSMRDDGKIEVLNRCISKMLQSFADEDTARGEIRVAVITFGGDSAQIHQPLVSAARARWTDMEASGRTPMGHAFDLANAMLDDEELVPRRSFRPTVVLCSDGRPTDDWSGPLERLVHSRHGDRALRLAVGIGADLDDEARTVLHAFVGDPDVHLITAERVDRIVQFFEFVTLSVTSRIQGGRPDEIPPFSPDDLSDLL